MKKKILIIATTPFLNDGLTKIEMDIYDWYKEKADFEFASSFGFENRFGAKLTDEKVPTHLLSQKRNVLAYMNSIFRLVNNNNYDVIYIHGNSALMFLEAVPARFGRAKAIVAHCHNTKTNYPIVHYLAKPVFNLVLDKKIGCSSLATHWAFCGKNIITIPNGVDTDKFQYNNELRYLTRKELGIKSETLIGHIGRFSEQKNHMKIVDVFNNYKKIDKSAKLLLIGNGEKKNEVKNRIKKNSLENDVIFIDETLRPENYMSAMDVMFMPSVFEGLCLVALEAQANGLPLVISDKFSYETIITKYVTMIDIEADDDTWVHAIKNSINNNGHYNISYLEKKQIDWKTMMEQIGEVVLNV